jgi:hypothetical protein
MRCNGSLPSRTSLWAIGDVQALADGGVLELNPLWTIACDSDLRAAAFAKTAKNSQMQSRVYVGI